MSEMQNAYEAGKMINFQRQAADSREIAEALNAGTFALVAVVPAYCPFTDAVTGTARFLVSTHATRAEASHAAGTQYEQNPGEIDYIVLPELPRTTAPADFDDISF